MSKKVPLEEILKAAKTYKEIMLNIREADPDVELEASAFLYHGAAEQIADLFGIEIKEEEPNGSN